VLTAEVIAAGGGCRVRQYWMPIMGMNKIYYRFDHLTSNQRHATLPARLQMKL
jgi:hypothetical protein